MLPLYETNKINNDIALSTYQIHTFPAGEEAAIVAGATDAILNEVLGYLVNISFFEQLKIRYPCEHMYFCNLQKKIIR